MNDAGRRLAPVVRLAPAKLNLTLAVVGRRADGYHALHSVVMPLGLADRLTLAVRATGPDSLHVEGHDAGRVEDNLVIRAIAATRAAAQPLAAGPAGCPPLAARLDKRIPVAAGLGGGSSDAAATIDAALEAWGIELSTDRRTSIAAGLGSDVPLFLAGGPALIEGRGERVTALQRPRGEPIGVLLVTPALPVHAADVYDVLAAGVAPPPAAGSTRLASDHLAQELKGGLAAKDLLARAGVLASANDLVAATALVAPAIVPFRRTLMRRLGRPVGQSGSGPTLYALYPSLDAADEAAETVRAAVTSGELPTIAAERPFIHATTIGTDSSAITISTDRPAGDRPGDLLRRPS